MKSCGLFTLDRRKTYTRIGPKEDKGLNKWRLSKWRPPQTSFHDEVRTQPSRKEANAEWCKRAKTLVTPGHATAIYTQNVNTVSSKQEAAYCQVAVYTMDTMARDWTLLNHSHVWRVLATIGVYRTFVFWTSSLVKFDTSPESDSTKKW